MHWKTLIHTVGIRPHQPILLNTLPKSGSRYIFKALRDGLGLKGFPALHPFHYEGAELHETVLKQLVRKKRLSQSHLFPLKHNIQRLAARLDKVIVHVRDPRQAILSWMHEMEHNESVLFPTGEYINCSELDWETYADLVIDKEYPYFVEFIKGWLSVFKEENRGFDMLLTRHNKLSDDPEGFFKEIMDFLDMPHWVFIFPKPPRVGSLNFRKNDPNEWRTSFSKQQQEHMSAALDHEILDYFGWLQE